MAAAAPVLAPIRANKAAQSAARGAAPVPEESPLKEQAAPGTQYSRSALPPNPASLPVDPPDENRSSRRFVSQFSSMFVQCKLAIGSSDDPLEAEADQAAAQVMRQSTVAKPGMGTRLPVLRRATQSGATASAATAPPIVHRALASPGQPLDAQTRAFMEPRFGRDLSHIRLHTDAVSTESARAVGALAYTVGHHIAFGAGAYDPASASGRNLLAHELAHTVQQSDVGAASLDDAILRRRRIPDSSGVDALVSPGATDQAAHKAGLLRQIRNTWNEMDADSRRAASVALIRNISITLESHPNFFQSNDDWNLQWVVVRVSRVGAAGDAELARGVGNPLARLTHTSPTVTISPTVVGGPPGRFSSISFEIATGTDDLRGNSVATAHLLAGNGAVIQEIPLKRQADASWDDRSVHTVSEILHNVLPLDQIIAALDAGSIDQLKAFAREIQVATPDSVLGDPHLIDSGPRPGAQQTPDQNNINTLVDQTEQRVFNVIISGARDADLRQVFGAAHVAEAKQKCRLAKAEMRRLQHIGKILTDWSGYSEEAGVGGLTFFHKQIAVAHSNLDGPTLPDSIATMFHESMHAGNSSVVDNGYILTPPFLTLNWPLKLNNAAHFEVIAYRILDPSNDRAYPDPAHPGHFLEFVPAGTGGTPPLTARQDAIGRANRKFEAAWDTADDLHGILVRVYEHPEQWNDLDLHASPDFGVTAGTRFSQCLPYWSKVQRMTIHKRTGYPLPIPFPAPPAPVHPPHGHALVAPALTPSSSPVTLIDIAQSEHVTHKMSQGMDETGAQAMTVARAVARESTATAAQTAQIALGPQQEADVLVALVRTQTIGEITGPPGRDIRVIDRLAQAHNGTYGDILTARDPATFPD